jgi:hypothetical protein
MKVNWGWMVAAVLVGVAAFGYHRGWVEFRKPGASATPVAEPSPPLAEQEPAPVRRAPPGVVYLLDRVVVSTPGGLEGWAPGKKVRIHEQRADRLLVGDGISTATVDIAQVTDEEEMAELARGRDARSQEALKQHVAAQRAAFERARKEDFAKTLEGVGRAPAAPALVLPTPVEGAALASATPSKALDRGAYNQRRAVTYRPFAVRYYVPESYARTIYYDGGGRRYFRDGRGVRQPVEPPSFEVEKR